MKTIIKNMWKRKLGFLGKVVDTEQYSFIYGDHKLEKVKTVFTYV